MITLNGTPVKPTIFPDKTSQVWHVDPSALYASSPSFVIVKWKFESEAEVMHLVQLKQLLDKCNKQTCLFIDYLPYARQDKGISNDVTFALYSLAHVLNSLNFVNVIITDPHSEVALKLIERSAPSYPIPTIQDVIQKTGSTMIFYPDDGAVKKYQSIYSELNLPFITGWKRRDQKTGTIAKYAIEGDPLHQDTLIVDDLCDGGATFILAAKALLDAGAEKICLFTTHGIYSKGVGVLKEAGIHRIFNKEGEVS